VINLGVIGLSLLKRREIGFRETMIALRSFGFSSSVNK